MKVRDSGMPEEITWNKFFNIEQLLQVMEIDSGVVDLVEIGSGYGTFTIPAAKLIRGRLFAFDIESEMIELLSQKVQIEKTDNVLPENKDILASTTGLASNSVNYVMLFNILHHDTPLDFIDEAHRILKPGGKIGIIHWRSDIVTPRGPDLSIRPKPENILSWIDDKRFIVDKQPFIIEPYHFGLIISKK